MNFRINTTKLYISSRAIILALLFFVLPLNARFYLDYLFDITMFNTDKTVLFASESQVKTECTYTNIVSYMNRDDSSSTDLLWNAFQTTSSFTLVTPNGGIAGEYQTIAPHFELTHQTEENYGRTEVQTSLSKGIFHWWLHLPSGFSVGTSLGLTMGNLPQRDSSVNTSITSPITVLLNSMPGHLAGVFRYSNNLIHSELSLLHTLNTAMVPKYTNLKTQSYKTAPFALVESHSSLQVGVHSKETDSISLSFEMIRNWGHSNIYSSHALPIIPELLTYSTALWGRKKRFSAHCQYWWGTSYIHGYDSPDQTSRFLIFDNLSQKRASIVSSFLGEHLSGSLYGEFFEGAMNGNGYVDFYPMSAWTIFRQKAYRYSSGIVSFRHVGGELTWFKKWKNEMRSNLSLASGYADIYLAAHQETQKIAVLIPLYTNDTSITDIDSKLLLNDIRIEHEIPLGKGVCTLSAKQIIPIILSSKEKIENRVEADNSSKPDYGDKDTNSNKEEHKYGGLTLSMNISWPINLHRRHF